MVRTAPSAVARRSEPCHTSTPPIEFPIQCRLKQRPGADTPPNGRLVSDGSRVNAPAHSPRASPFPPNSPIQPSCLAPRVHGRPMGKPVDRAAALPESTHTFESHALGHGDWASARRRQQSDWRRLSSTPRGSGCRSFSPRPSGHRSQAGRGCSRRKRYRPARRGTANCRRAAG